VSGTAKPEDIVKAARLVRRSPVGEGGSITGAFLAPVLGRQENKRKKGVQAAE
jgi:hypothetical protein